MILKMGNGTNEMGTSLWWLTIEQKNCSGKSDHLTKAVAEKKPTLSIHIPPVSFNSPQEDHAYPMLGAINLLHSSLSQRSQNKSAREPNSPGKEKQEDVAIDNFH